MIEIGALLLKSIAGCVAVSVDSGVYAVDVGGSVRPATAQELHDAAALLATARIKAERDRRKNAGTPAGGHVFHSDSESRIQQLGLVMMGSSMPAGIMWKTIGNGFVEMTPTLAGQIFTATATRDAQLFGVAEQHIAAAAASEYPLAYDYSTGWPA